MTLGQKIIKALTFGAVDPNNKNKPAAQKQQQRKQSQPKQQQQKKPVSKGNQKKRPPKVHEVTSARLYVGNLDYKAVESDLEDLFRGVGNVVSAEVVINSRTEQSKGFAFVEMSTIEEAKRAVEVLHDQEFMSRKLLVSGAKSDGPRERKDSAEAA